MSIKLIPIALFVFIGYIGCFAQERELKTEEDGFQWYRISENGYEGAQDIHGNTIVPLEEKFNSVIYRDDIKLFQVAIDEGGDFKFGFYHKNGRGFSPRDYENVIPVEQKEGQIAHVRVQKNGKEGIYDYYFNQIIPAIYSSAHGADITCKYAFYIKQGERWGVVDLKGNIIIPIKYDAILCEEGYFLIQNDKLWGVCDIKGKEIIKPKYSGPISYFDNEFSYYDYSDNSSHKIKKMTLKTRSLPYYDMGWEYTVALTSKESAKDYFELAYSSTDTDAQKTIDLYKQVVVVDPWNMSGYNTLAYNNIGCLYSQLGDQTNAKIYFEAALKANSNNNNAKENLRNLKSAMRSERLNNIAEALSAFGEGLQSVAGQTVGSTYNGNQNSNYNNVSQGSGSSYSSAKSGSNKCKECAGNGKCSGSGSSSKYHCHGSGKCYACHGKSSNGVGMHETAGHYGDCNVCGNTGKCKYCDGTGKCSRCGGTGKI